MVICLERGADLHMAQLMLLPLTVSCCSKIQIGFTFLVPAYPGFLEKRPLNGCKWLFVSCFGKIRIGFTFLVPAHLGSPGKRAVEWVRVCVCVCVYVCACVCVFVFVFVYV